MDQPAQQLAPVKNLNKGEVVKVNDSANRSFRTAQNIAFVGLVIGGINRMTGMNLTVDQAFIVLAVLAPTFAYLRNVAEFRGWIPSTKKEAAEIAPPKNDAGQTLAQVK